MRWLALAAGFAVLAAIVAIHEPTVRRDAPCPGMKNISAPGESPTEWNVQ